MKWRFWRKEEPKEAPMQKPIQELVGEPTRETPSELVQSSVEEPPRKVPPRVLSAAEITRNKIRERMANRELLTCSCGKWLFHLTQVYQQLCLPLL